MLNVSAAYMKHALDSDASSAYIVRERSKEV